MVKHSNSSRADRSLETPIRRFEGVESLTEALVSLPTTCSFRITCLESQGVPSRTVCVSRSSGSIGDNDGKRYWHHSVLVGAGPRFSHAWPRNKISSWSVLK